MKRLGNTFTQICDYDNLVLAHKNARKGKTWYREVKEVDDDLHNHILAIQEMLLSGEYKTSSYKVKTIKDRKKERVIHVLPYFPDRIVHHAIMNICNSRWEKSLIRDTFQSIKGRGTSDAFNRVRSFIKKHSPKYYLQVDIKKYYPSINNNILKHTLRRTIKCKATLSLLDEIIDSVDGVPIGNYLSQIFGNLYLSSVDWWIKQDLGINGYFRYCDDLVLMGDDPKTLHHLKTLLENKLGELGLEIKPNWKVRDIADTGLDFVGYVFRDNKVTLRKSILKNFLSNNNKQALCSYWGWIKPTTSHSIWHKRINKINENTIT